MNDNSVYLNEPKISVAESAWNEYVAFRKYLTDAEIQKRIKLLHYSHVRKMLAADQLSGDGAVIVTDIPGYDLALMDANFPPLKQRQTTLFSRAGAAFVAGILARSGHSVPLVQ